MGSLILAVVILTCYQIGYSNTENIISPLIATVEDAAYILKAIYHEVSAVLRATKANVGPLVKATKGEVWPKPQKQEKHQTFFSMQPESFSFKAPDNIGCPSFLDSALMRYSKIITDSSSWERRGRIREANTTPKKSYSSDKNYLGILETLVIKLTGECPSEDVRPQLGDVESYEITVSTTEQILSAPTIWGILRGLETFAQSIYFDEGVLLINGTTISDFPRLPHRGLLLDTGRHFLPVDTIFQMLDAMSFNKLNVFHWHITETRSFPYQSKVFPELSDKGAFHPVSRVYTLSDVKNVIEQARLRGIRVIPEFDTPGHSSSWGASHPELLTVCYAKGKPTNDLGPMDPTKNSTYKFLNALFSEVVSLFPDAYFHIGGDEVNPTCWKSNPQITAFMVANNIRTLKQLENYYVENVIKLLHSLGSKPMVWEEAFSNGADLPKSAIVQIWRINGKTSLSRVTSQGKFAIYSSCWYLDYLFVMGGDWERFYLCDPLDFPGSDEQKRLVLGGEVCMWQEVVNEHNIMPRVWPRASAAAEKLWSSDTKSLEDARARLEEHACTTF